MQPQTTVPQNWDDPLFTRQHAQNLLYQSGHILLVHPHGGHLLAKVLPSAVADILTLFVPANARRHGHAQHLMHALITHAKAQNTQGLALEVRASNTAAISLYSKLGLAQITRRKAYYTNPPEDAVVLALNFS